MALQSVNPNKQNSVFETVGLFPTNRSRKGSEGYANVFSIAPILFLDLSYEKTVSGRALNKDLAELETRAFGTDGNCLNDESKNKT